MGQTEYSLKFLQKPRFKGELILGVKGYRNDVFCCPNSYCML